jgi:8-amino-7-oxononanoate synthase
VAAHLAGAENLITLHTCGKALGVEGALVCGSRVLIDILINKARPFVFSTAPSPLMAIAVGAALEQISGVRGNALRSDLAALRKFAGDALCGPLGLPSPASQIVPVILGDDKRTMQVAGALQQAGFDVRGIRPPTVPAGTGRLRVSITRNVRPDDIQQLASLLVPMVNKDMAA